MFERGVEAAEDEPGAFGPGFRVGATDAVVEEDVATPGLAITVSSAASMNETPTISISARGDRWKAPGPRVPPPAWPGVRRGEEVPGSYDWRILATASSPILESRDARALDEAFGRSLSPSGRSEALAFRRSLQEASCQVTAG